MARNFYEILGIEPDASTEEVRRAYRRRALDTHPDRRSAIDREAATEEFRKVARAYEILSDAEKRRVYDTHGRVWPPPEETPPPFSTPSFSSWPRDPFSTPFESVMFPSFFPFGSMRAPWGPELWMGVHTAPSPFTDPFILFDQFFASSHRDLLSGPLAPFESPFGWPPMGSGFSGRGSTFPFHSTNSFEGFMGGSNMPGANYQAHSYSSSMGGSSNNWTSQSQVTQTINGVTETVIRRRDVQGNEYVEHIRPDGSRRITINGVERPRVTDGPRHGGITENHRGRIPEILPTGNSPYSERLPRGYDDHFTAPGGPPQSHSGSRWQF